MNRSVKPSGGYYSSKVQNVLRPYVITQETTGEYVNVQKLIAQ